MAGNYEIIVVDDDVSMRRAIERLLGAAGWKTRSFSCAEDFLASDALVQAACLILDIQLPGMSGLDLHQLLVADGFKPRVIFITGHDLPFLREKAERSGVAAYFTKPFPGDELLEAVRRHLSAA